ncbi:hypothetical protein F441_03472 [Phytophthora nicotianae CJ01A1]|uniref:Uncharacterized protein n=6 Tax=Phytophthora nicotianae TaxID=4792 RepID=W2QKX3_PHYN3|nr:hypothetical protein PPTG_22240 [Phytophthora nicotianae INRA-310]ETI53580.1 hypothetical protein F443_03494 [Phytophthora nicotianae P1569]ETK93444.1 hypothetical protein L915_03381 [Phytophthora nicotianae]ETO82284.1 hypothetical protein F444_03548 [Phytophthora nicotianae P1976]ETP23379.1 hypothetical protein F441_03472 [Phytophthora nicotianae CJ01A1]ETP51376.1 hypothetical protein F442_03475 [Phytophthora nicotianae P10297]
MSQLIERTVDHYDRQAGAISRGLYTRSEVSRQRLSVEASTKAVMGEARAQASIFEAGAYGPNVGAHARAGVGGVGGFLTAELGRVEVKTGVVNVGMCLNINSGIHVGVDNFKVKILGVTVYR